MASGRLLKGGASLVVACVLVAVALSARGRPTSLAADVQYVSGAAKSRKAADGNSQLADLMDSPLLLVRKKVNDYLKMDDPEDALAARERMGGPLTVPGQKKAKCTGLKCTDGVWENDYRSAGKDHMKDVMGDRDPKYDPANKPFAGEWGDQQQPVTIGNVVKELKDNLSAMKERFREIKARFSAGAPRVLRIKVRPRGPQGDQGPGGDVGDQGDTGMRGDFGRTGIKGATGPRGPRGDKGGKGKRGIPGVIGKPGGPGGLGNIGNQGKEGYTGPAGSRGPPGSPGVAGANGRDGTPGPPGHNSPSGRPGKAGPPGGNGVAGLNGNVGERGLSGFRGQTGSTGGAGPRGNQGYPGAAGVGPPTPGDQLSGGSFPDGKCYAKKVSCRTLGVADSLCGRCEPVCVTKRCNSAEVGFKLTNEWGLRWAGATFDKANLGTGSIQARNMCALARYGNLGKIALDATANSFATNEGGDQDAGMQKHWYGGCLAGSDKSKCCTNAKLLSSGFDWQQFAMGDACTGNSDRVPVVTSVTCVFDDKLYDVALGPKPVSDTLPAGESIYAGREGISDEYLQSANGDCQLIMKQADKGDWSLDILMLKTKETAWTTPLGSGAVMRLVVEKDGGFAGVVTGTGKEEKTLWAPDGIVKDKLAIKFQLTDQCILKLFTKGPAEIWTSEAKDPPKEAKEGTTGGDDAPDAPSKSGYPNGDDTTVPPASSGLVDGSQKSLILGFCGAHRDTKLASTEGKQLENFQKCMEQDCALSLNDEIGCRYMDANGFCYIAAKSQKWCLDNPQSSFCYDGGESWGWAAGSAAQGKMGTAKGSVTAWVPQVEVPLYDPDTGKSSGKFGCACFKNCACEFSYNLAKSKCRCANGEAEEAVGDETQVMPRILSSKSSGSAGKCGCVCNHKYGEK